MSLMLDDIALLYPDQLVLEFSSQQRDRAWEKTANLKYQDATSRWRSFLNTLCSNTITHYIQSDSNFRNSKLETYAHFQDFPHLWQLINGVPITLNETRLIIIPSEETEAEELRVPQEWVDLPGWVGNYYLASRIDLENCFLRVLGFVTHEELWKQGHYDSLDKTYSLEITALTEDLSAMWVAWELSADTLPQVASLPKLSMTEAENLIKQNQYARASTLRLAMPFQQWGSLLLEPELRHLLYNYQLANDSSATTLNQERIINVAQWFKRSFEGGWCSIEKLINDNSLKVAYSFRQKNSQESDHVAEGVKLLDLGSEVEKEVALIVKIFSQKKETINVRIQLQSVNGENYLPSNIKLKLLSNSSQVIQEVKAGDKDNLIQLKEFTCQEGIFIHVQVTLGDLTLTESFKVAIP